LLSFSIKATAQQNDKISFGKCPEKAKKIYNEGVIHGGDPVLVQVQESNKEEEDKSKVKK